MPKNKSDVEKIKQLVKKYHPVLRIDWRTNDILVPPIAELEQWTKDEDFLNEQFAVLFQASFARVCEHINDYYGEKI